MFESMSTPWLPDGWRRAAGGDAVSGYGYWERTRPRWEPRVYPAFAAALRLLDPEIRGIAVASEQLVAPLQPAARGRIDLSGGDGEPAVRMRAWRQRSDDADEIQVLYDDRGEERFKLWIRAGYRKCVRAASNEAESCLGGAGTPGTLLAAPP